MPNNTLIPRSFTQDIEKKKRQREQKTQGILYHAAIENSKNNKSTFLFLLEEKAEQYFHEFEIWQNKDKIFRFANTTRNVLDFIALYELDCFKQILDNELIVNSENENHETLNAIKKQNKETKIILVLDYKTGEKNIEDKSQIENYMKLASTLIESSWFSPKNEKHLFLVIGALYYRDIRNKKECIYFYQGIK